MNKYINMIQNKKNYNIVIFNLQKNFLIILNINYNFFFKKNYNLYLKLLKNFFIENGLKILLLEYWYKIGIKYNFILKLLS